MEIEVTADLVRHVAGLARLELSDEERAALEDHFRKVLSYVAAFETLDTESVEPSQLSVETSNVFREDEPRPSPGVEAALRNAPGVAPPYFVVPRIVGGTDDVGGAA